MFLSVSTGTKSIKNDQETPELSKTKWHVFMAHGVHMIRLGENSLILTNFIMDMNVRNNYVKRSKC